MFCHSGPLELSSPALEPGRERDLPGMAASAEETRGVRETNLSEPSAAPGVRRSAG